MVFNTVDIRTSSPKDLDKMAFSVLDDAAALVEKYCAEKKLSGDIVHYRREDVVYDQCELDIFFNGAICCTMREPILSMLDAEEVVRPIKDMIDACIARSLETQD